MIRLTLSDRAGCSFTIAAATAYCFIGTAASAQKVQLLAFDDPPADALPAPSPADETSMADALAAGFDALAPAAASAVAPKTSIVMPTWLRPSGGQDSAPVTPVTVNSGVCAALPYRPRRDLVMTTELRRARLYPLVAQAACEAGIPVGLFDALIVQESRYNQAVVSPKGAIGLSQLMPGTARYLSVANPFDALSNLRGGARYLREQLTAFGRVDLALAAYNAGPGRVRARWSVPRIRETLGYVASVTKGWHMGVVHEASLVDFRAASPPLPPSAPIVGRTAQVFRFDSGT